MGKKKKGGKKIDRHKKNRKKKGTKVVNKNNITVQMPESKEVKKTGLLAVFDWIRKAVAMI